MCHLFFRFPDTSHDKKLGLIVLQLFHFLTAMADNFFARTENNTSVLNSQNVYWPKIWHRLEGTEVVSGWERSLAIHRRK